MNIEDDSDLCKIGIHHFPKNMTDIKGLCTVCGKSYEEAVFDLLHDIDILTEEVGKVDRPQYLN